MAFNFPIHAKTSLGGLVVASVVLFAALTGHPGSASAQTMGPTVFAAASMKTALDEVGALWTAKTGKKAIVSYASSSALAKQMEQGAPADVFVSADIPWMDHVASKNLIRPETRTDLLGNELVLVAPAPTNEKIALAPGVDLAAMIGDGKLATGDPASVPAGKYAKAALEKLGVWNEVRPKIAGAENVRAALTLVARGEAKYGIVYSTDARAEPKVAVIGVFPKDGHPPIVYPAAITKDSTHPDAAAYLAFLKGPEAMKVFLGQGFTVPSK
ncbi:MAG: molybdate ABC transporter substrate-binding protein [Siculibacillus sp.]|nr:molybdate ABC transporter substrate-binding protein [Siculibacillus sp.]